MNFVPFLPHSCSLTSLEPHGGCKDNPGIAVCMLSSSVVVAAEEVRQHYVILDGPSCSIQIAIVNSAICLSAVKVDYCFDF